MKPEAPAFKPVRASLSKQKIHRLWAMLRIKIVLFELIQAQAKLQQAQKLLKSKNEIQIKQATLLLMIIGDFLLQEVRIKEDFLNDENMLKLVQDCTIALLSGKYNEEVTPLVQDFELVGDSPFSVGKILLGALFPRAKGARVKRVLLNRLKDNEIHNKVIRKELKEVIEAVDIPQEPESFWERLLN